jgi:phosphatidylglycerophosphate synthase
MLWVKRVADALTVSRVGLALAVVWIALRQGADGAVTVMWLLVLTATIDTLDGILARRSGCEGQTWIGEHDVEFDVVFSVSLLYYLCEAGFVPLVGAALYFAVWMVLFWHQDTISTSFAVLFQGPLYLWVVLVGVLDDPGQIKWLLGWGVVMLVFGGRRFLGKRVPAFFRDLQEQTSRRKH